MTDRSFNNEKKLQGVFFDHFFEVTVDDLHFLVIARDPADHDPAFEHREDEGGKFPVVPI